MVDERSRASADEVHDDDELAEALAAELERYATGAIPVVGAAARPPRAADVPPQGRTPTPPEPPRAESPGAEVPSPSSESGFRRQDRRTPAPFEPSSPVPPTGPIRRRSGFVHPGSASPAADIDPLERVLPTRPTVLPEATGAILDAMVAGSLDDDEPEGRRARHRDPVPIEISDIEDPLRITGPLALSPGLYDDWEQSLRSIGRPRQSWEDEDGDIVVGSGADTPTVALRVQPTTGSVPPAPRGAHTAPVDLSALAGQQDLGAFDTGSFDTGGVDTDPRRPRGRRRAAGPVDDGSAESAPVPVLSGPIRTAARTVGDDDIDGIDDVVDDVATDHVQVSAAATGAIELPSVEPRTRTTPVLIERVRTAILQLPVVSPSSTGSGAVALLGRWLGAFASPVLIVLGFALSGVDAGPVGVAALGLGLLLVLPAAGRAAAWAAANRADGDTLERELLGPVAGRAMGIVLLIARLAATVVALLAAGSVASAFAARTGVLTGSASAAALAAVLAVGVLAILITVWPPGITAALLLVFAAIGLLVTALMLLVLGQSAGGSSTAAGVLAAAAVGFGPVGLVLVLCGPDVVRLRTGTARPVRAAIATVLGGVVGLVVVALAIGAGGGAGAATGAADAFAGTLADATAAPLAAPLGVAIIAGAVTLPALLVRATGAAAARVLGAGRSERLGALAVGLLALACALGLVAIGTDAGAALLVAGAVVGVPVAAWAGVLTAMPFGGRGSRGIGVAIAVATVVGWLLTNGLGSPDERSPVLSLLGLADGPWAGGPVLGLAIAFVIGILSALVVRIGGRQARPASIS